MTIDTVLVASDLKQGGSATIDAAVALAQQYQARLVGLHVLSEDELESLQEDLPAESSYLDTVTGMLLSDLRAEVDASSPGDIPVSLKVEEGEPGETILRVARDEAADVIVIGVRHRSRVGKLLLGSTPQEVLLNSPCPVFAVPSRANQ